MKCLSIKMTIILLTEKKHRWSVPHALVWILPKVSQSQNNFFFNKTEISLQQRYLLLKHRPTISLCQQFGGQREGGGLSSIVSLFQCKIPTFVNQKSVFTFSIPCSTFHLLHFELTNAHSFTKVTKLQHTSSYIFQVSLAYH